MPIDNINGVNLYWEMSGNEGEPLVLVHGSWVDHHDWDRVVGELSKNFRVITYDRRGHSQSQRLPQQGTMEEDVFDLIALIEHLDISPVHVAGNSGGGAVALKTAVKKPEIFRSLNVHEPPLFGLLKDVKEAQPMLQVVEARIRAVIELIVSGENEQAARLFVETIAIGPNAWPQLPDPIKHKFTYNAPTFLDEIQDPDNLEFDLRKLSNFNKPTLLSAGVESPPFFVMTLDKIGNSLPSAKRLTFQGAGHIPHLSHPEQYVEAVKQFAGVHEKV